MAQPMGMSDNGTSPWRWKGDGGTAHGDGWVMMAQPMGTSDHGTAHGDGRMMVAQPMGMDR